MEKMWVESLPTGKSWHRGIAHVRTFKCKSVRMCVWVCKAKCVCVWSCVYGWVGCRVQPAERSSFTFCCCVCDTSGFKTNARLLLLLLQKCAKPEQQYKYPAEIKRAQQPKMKSLLQSWWQCTVSSVSMKSVWCVRLEMDNTLQCCLFVFSKQGRPHMRLDCHSRGFPHNHSQTCWCLLKRLPFLLDLWQWHQHFFLWKPINRI